MPWSSEAFPPSMRQLSEAARDKAIEMANALLAQGTDEGKAIRIAIAKAKQWAADHDLPIRNDEA
jgi:uncharacterized protein YdaT